MPLRHSMNAALVAVTATFGFGRPVPPPDPFMGPGVSRELAAERAANLSGIRYHMDLSLVSRDTARGTITVAFTAKRAADVVVDFRGPKLADVRVNGAATQTTFNGAHLRIPASAIHPGQNELAASFSALIAPAGASIIRFHDDRDNADYLYTLFVPSDANALFPCF